MSSMDEWLKKMLGGATVAEPQPEPAPQTPVAEPTTQETATETETQSGEKEPAADGNVTEVNMDYYNDILKDIYANLNK